MKLEKKKALLRFFKSRLKKDALQAIPSAKATASPVLSEENVSQSVKGPRPRRAGFVENSSNSNVNNSQYTAEHENLKNSEVTGFGFEESLPYTNSASSSSSAENTRLRASPVNVISSSNASANNIRHTVEADINYSDITEYDIDELLARELQAAFSLEAEEYAHLLEDNNSLRSNGSTVDVDEELAQFLGLLSLNELDSLAGPSSSTSERVVKLKPHQTRSPTEKTTFQLTIILRETLFLSETKSINLFYGENKIDHEALEWFSTEEKQYLRINIPLQSIQRNQEPIEILKRDLAAIFYTSDDWNRVQMTINSTELIDSETIAQQSQEEEGWISYFYRLAAGSTVEKFLTIELDHLVSKKACVVDTDDHVITEFPKRITVECDHEPNICRDCLQRTILLKLDQNDWDKIKCPECPATITYEDMKRLLGEEDFERFDAMSLRSHLSSDKDFHWCVRQSCKSGQIHSLLVDGQRFSCTTCKLDSCLSCAGEWHDGETCEAYKYRASGQKAQDEELATEETKRRTTKQCPSCKTYIEKNDGCDHMTCRKCRYEFCWLCLVDYNLIRRGSNSAHQTTCQYYGA